MRKSAPIEVVVHYPKTEEGWKELGKRVAKAGFKNHRENKGCRLRAAHGAVNGSTTQNGSVW